MLKSKTYIRGMDISKYEPKVDWDKVIKDDIHYVIMKASQGKRIDREFVRLWQEAKGIMPRGAYMFFDGRFYKPKRQIETLIEALDGDLGELPLVVDIEGRYAYGLGRYTGWKNWYDTLEYLSQAVPDKQLMIYTNVGTWDRHAPRGAELAYFTKFPLWVANYKVKTPRIPRGWNDWLFWQYSENAFIDGVLGGSNRPTTVDVNWFNGSADDLKLLAGMEVPPEKEPVPGASTEGAGSTNYPFLADEITWSTSGTPLKPKPIVTITVQGDVEIKVEHEKS